MDANAVYRCLCAWDALTLETDTALSATGADGGCYPRTRLLLAWDIDRYAARLPDRLRRAVDDVRYGDGDQTTAHAQELACRAIAAAMRLHGRGSDDDLA